MKGKKAGHRAYVNRWALAAAKRIRTTDDRIFIALLRVPPPHDSRAAPSAGCRLAGLRATLATDLIAATTRWWPGCSFGHKGGVTQEH